MLCSDFSYVFVDDKDGDVPKDVDTNIEEGHEKTEPCAALICKFIRKRCRHTLEDVAGQKHAESSWFVRRNDLQGIEGDNANQHLVMINLVNPWL